MDSRYSAIRFRQVSTPIKEVAAATASGEFARTWHLSKINANGDLSPEAKPQQSVTDPSEWSFKPLSTAFARDPYASYEILRARKPFHYFADFDVWLVSRFRDVTDVVMNRRMVRTPESFLSAEQVAVQKRRENFHDMPYHSRFVQFSLLDSEGEVHRRLRQQVFHMLTSAAVEDLRSYIQEFVDEQINALMDRREIDFVEDFAAVLPGHVIGRLLGVPSQDCPQLRGWSENIVQYFDIDRSDERKALAEATTAEFYDYLKGIKAARIKAPKVDLISQLIKAENAGLMNEDEFISTCMLILMAGHGSTIDALGSGMHALLRYPDQMLRLRRDPSLIETAVQEMFRYESPLPFMHRYTTEDIEINGQSFSKGTKFGVLYGSANRDPEQFEKPNDFDVGRQPNRHLAFARGPHFCMGNHLSRLDMEIVFTTMLRRFSEINLVEKDPEYRRGLSVRGPKSLRIEFTPA
jgi:cytochrome P450